VIRIRGSIAGRDRGIILSTASRRALGGTSNILTSEYWVQTLRIEPDSILLRIWGRGNVHGGGWRDVEECTVPVSEAEVSRLVVSDGTSTGGRRG
jgi:hypothetical protein